MRLDRSALGAEAGATAMAATVGASGSAFCVGTGSVRGGPEVNVRNALDDKDEKAREMWPPRPLTTAFGQMLQVRVQEMSWARRRLGDVPHPQQTPSAGGARQYCATDMSGHNSANKASAFIGAWSLGVGQSR